MALLIVCTIVHFYTTGHLTAVTALKSLDAEFEAVSASLKVPFFTTLRRVTLPICTPTLVDIARYFFVNAMTTISAVVFLYSPDTKVAAIAILNLDEAGEAGAAAACAMLITARLDRGDAAVHGGGRADRPAHPGLAARRGALSGRRSADNGYGDCDAARRDPSDPRSPDHDRAHQAGDAARLGLVGRELHRRHHRAAHAAARRSSTARARTSSCRSRAAAPSRSRRRWRRSCRATGHVLVLDNGAYCKRHGQAVDADGPQDDDPAACRGPPVSPQELEAALRRDPSITHVGFIHCETGTGVANPLQAVADVCARHGKGLIVDAMSSFAALPIDARKVKFDALVAASGKCLEGVPGMGFVFIRKDVIDGAAGNSHSLAMDLHDQHVYMEKTGQWRFTPPTHVVAALAEAMRQFEEEGGQPARLARYTAQLRGAGRRHEGARLRALPRPGDPGADHRHLPCAGRSALRLPAVLRRACASTASSSTRASSPSVETFRVGCIGAIGPEEMKAAVAAVAATMKELGIASGAPNLR